MNTRLIIPLLHDGQRFYPNPDPENLIYPAGTGILIADERVTLIPGDQPIPSSAVMAYRYNDANPYQLERGLHWPEIEYPCLTVDYSITEPSRGADLADYAAFWKMTDKQPVAFEYAIWDARLRGEGAGARDPNSTLGRLWPDQGQSKYVVTVRVQSSAPQQPEVVIGDPVWMTRIGFPNEMGVHQGEDGNQYRKVI